MKLVRWLDWRALMFGSGHLLLMLAALVAGEAEAPRWVVGGIFAALGAAMVVMMARWYLGLPGARWWVVAALLAGAFVAQAVIGVWHVDQGAFSFWGVNLVPGFYAVGQIVWVGTVHPEDRRERDDAGL